MLTRLTSIFKSIISKFAELDITMLVIPGIILASSFIIRVLTGGTHLIYNILDGHGIFPGVTFYTVCFITRACLLGFIVADTIKFSYGRYASYEIWGPLAFAVVIIVTEYKLIFGGVSLILSIIFSITIPVITIIPMMKVSRCKKTYILWIFLTLLQIMLFVQLISLSFYV